MHCERILLNICNWLKNYYIDNNLKGLVLGVSGGADSALIAAIIKRIPSIPLHCLWLPSRTNKEGEFERACNIIDAFADYKKTVEIDNLVSPTLNFLDLCYDNMDIKDRIRRGNIYARQRMIILFDYAQSINGAVLSTDNKTEEELGFWTLHGDVGNIGPIQSLWKTEVFELLQYIADNSPSKEAIALGACISAIPTDGLGVSESDVEQFGVNNYNEVDEVLQNKEKHLVHHPIIQRHIRTMFKRNDPYNITRDQAILGIGI